MLERKFPLGKHAEPMAVVGNVGLDIPAVPEHDIEDLEAGQKRSVRSHPEMLALKARFGIREEEGRLGKSAFNFAAQAARTYSPEERAGKVHFYATLVHPDSDPSTPYIRDGVNDIGIVLHETTYVPPDGSTARNPFSYILPPDNDNKIVSYNDDEIIVPQMEPMDPNPSVLVLGALSGPWENNIGAVLKATNGGVDTPITLASSQTQIDQLKGNPHKRERYRTVLSKATLWEGNNHELKTVITALGEDPHGDPREWPKQLRVVSSNETLMVLRTRGGEGATFLDQNDISHRLVVPKLQHSGHGLGTGDTFNALVFQGMRAFGTSVDGISRSLRIAGQGARSVMNYPDAQSGQLEWEEFRSQPGSSFRHVPEKDGTELEIDVTEPRSQQFPLPPQGPRVVGA